MNRFLKFSAPIVYLTDDASHYTRYPIGARAQPLGRVRARAKVSCIKVPLHITEFLIILPHVVKLSQGIHSRPNSVLYITQKFAQFFT